MLKVVLSGTNRWAKSITMSEYAVTITWNRTTDWRFSDDRECSSVVLGPLPKVALLYAIWFMFVKKNLLYGAIFNPRPGS